MSFDYTVNTEFDYLFKILIIGESGVGYVLYLPRLFIERTPHSFRKTALLQRFSQDYFAVDYVATIGVGKSLVILFSIRSISSTHIDFQIRTIDVDTKRCKLQVWDTAGQDRFKCVVSTFYRGAHGVMICFDITDLESFRNVDTWLEEVKRYCVLNTPIFLVGNKSDLQSKRMVPYSTIKEYVENKELTYIETSAKTNENIENCFADFSRALVKHTNEIKVPDEDKEKRDSTVVLGKEIKKVRTGRCAGGSKCII